METSKIFIDAQSFRNESFKLEGRVLNKIKELGRSLLIEIYVSEVVKREVSSQILEEASDAKSNYNKFVRKIENLFESEVHKEFPELQDLTKRFEGFNDAALSRWNNFLQDSRAVVLSPNEICNIELLSLYFDGNPPFSEGKKKCEFPDAISMLSLKQKMSQSNDSVYVISQDNDLKKFCESESNLISLNRLSDFLDIYNKHHNRLSTIVKNYVIKETDWISECIEEEFKNQCFLFAENYEADIRDVMVDGLVLHGARVIEVEEGRAAIDIDCEISGTAQVSSPDYSTAIWDKEDSRHYTFEEIDNAFRHDDMYCVSMEVLFDESKDDLTEINLIDFNGGVQLVLRDYYDEYTYK